MNSARRDWAVFFSAVLLFQILVDVNVALDFPIARQILGFVYLTFVPGLVLLRIFRMQSLGFADELLFSVGLSIASVMFLGLTINQIALSLGFTRGLSTGFLLLATNMIVLLLCVLCYFLNKDVQWNKRKIDFSTPWIFIIYLPLLAVLGTSLVNLNGNSMILILMIGVVALLVLLGSVGVHTNWPMVLFMIALAVLLQTSLISNYLVGFDVHLGYHVFQITKGSGIWYSTINDTDPIISRANQMLSTTILPTIYSNVLDLEGFWVFKIVYPVIFALVPVGLFQIYQKYMRKRNVFIAIVFILADICFFAEMPGLPTQIIGEFFLVLTLLAIFREEIDLARKTILFTVFGAGIIVSHYGISYIFMFLLSIVWFVLLLRKRQSKIRLVHVILFFVMAFSWYMYTSRSGSFMAMLDIGQHISSSFWIDLLDAESRPVEALTAIGAGEPAVSMGHWLGRAIHYASQFFIILGIASLHLGRKDCKLDREFAAISLLMLIFVVSPLAVPSFNLLNMTRMYHVSLLFLAPFCTIGGNWFFSIIGRARASEDLAFGLTLIVITSLFLFETGFIYEVTGDVSYSVPLSMYRMERPTVYGFEYLSESVDVFGAKWLGSNIVFTENTTIYGDQVSTIKSPLTSSTVFPLDHMKVVSNVTLESVAYNGAYDYVYLRKFNTLDHKFPGAAGKIVWNTSDIKPLLESIDKIYANGGSEIFLQLD